MSSSGRQIEPNYQKRHTNISIVRYKKKGKKFEVACYKNKIFNYREGQEENIDEVLQTEDIYRDVATGERILKYGELQLSEKEREFIIEKKWKEIVNFITTKCLNPMTQRPYPPSVIDQEMKNVHFSIKMNKPSKTQALHCIKLLKKSIQIKRARMRILLNFPRSFTKAVKKKIKENGENCVIEDEQVFEKKKVLDSGEEEIKLWRKIIVLIDPFLFRPLRTFLSENEGFVEMLDALVQEEEMEKQLHSIKDVVEKKKEKEVDGDKKKNVKSEKKGGREKKKISRAERRNKRKEKKLKKKRKEMES